MTWKARASRQPVGAQHIELAVFEAQTGKTTYLPFVNASLYMHLSFAPSEKLLIGLTSADAESCGDAAPNMIRTLDPATMAEKVLFTFPTGYRCVYDYGTAFLSTTASSATLWAILLKSDSQPLEWTLFGVDVKTGEYVSKPAPLKRTGCPGEKTACLQGPLSLFWSRQHQRAFGLEAEVDMEENVGFQVAELNVEDSTIKPIGQIPAGANFNMGMNFLADNIFATIPLNETYYTLLMGGPAARAPIMFGVDVSSGEVVSADNVWEGTNLAPRPVQWVPAKLSTTTALTGATASGHGRRSSPVSRRRRRSLR